MAKKSKDYFGLPWIISIILAIIPITNIIFGLIIRIKKGNVLGVILNIILCPLFWLLDLITIIVSKKVSILA